MIDLLLQNAIPEMKIDGVINPFLTLKGDIAGRFYSASNVYDFAVCNNEVYYQRSRLDAGWIPPAGGVRRKMTPSAANQVKTARAGVVAKRNPDELLSGNDQGDNQGDKQPVRTMPVKGAILPGVQQKKPVSVRPQRPMILPVKQ